MVYIPSDTLLVRTDFDLVWKVPLAIGFRVGGETLYPLSFLSAEILSGLNLFRSCLF